MSKTYKKCKCLRCGNIFYSSAKKIKCIKGEKDGCNSTRHIVQEIEKNHVVENIKTQNEQQSENEEEFLFR